LARRFFSFNPGVTFDVNPLEAHNNINSAQTRRHAPPFSQLESGTARV
jgi:hypothetical protein